MIVIWLVIETGCPRWVARFAYIRCNSPVLLNSVNIQKKIGFFETANKLLVYLCDVNDERVVLTKQTSTNMSTTHRNNLTKVMNLAWDFVKKYGLNLSDALKKAWANIKLRARLTNGIVEFRFVKTDGSIRLAFGTLKADLVPPTVGSDRQRNDMVQAYYDTEKGAWRCFKKVCLCL